MRIRPSEGYRELRTFQAASIIYDATYWFCERFLDPRSRMSDQMVQAARSGRQNIAESSRASATSRRRNCGWSTSRAPAWRSCCSTTGKIAANKRYSLSGEQYPLPMPHVRDHGIWSAGDSCRLAPGRALPLAPTGR